SRVNDDEPREPSVSTAPSSADSPSSAASLLRNSDPWRTARPSGRSRASHEHARSISLPSASSTRACSVAVRRGRTAVVQRILLLCDGAALYAQRFDRSLYLVEREANERLPAAIVIASEPLTSESWVPLEDRTLVR